jgi:hypothetical protein
MAKEGKEMLQDLERLQNADDSFRRGEMSRREMRSIENSIIRNSIPKKPTGKKRA